ncbi:MAG: hypothetical protein HYR76_04155 [Ignavibacteria bacterium]|nr:hypothetical protein [Ignavibacteria bacterium]
MITTLSRYRRRIILGILPALLCILVKTPVIGQAQSNEDNRTSNVRWTTKDEVIIINYDLTGSPDNKYEVNVLMKREKDDSFAANPHTVEGDIGEGVTAGTGKEIHWSYRRDYPQGFQGEGYYFEIHVKIINQQSKLIYYLAGAAALTGGLVALIVTSKQDHTTPTLELPTPPGRP